MSTGVGVGDQPVVLEKSQLRVRALTAAAAAAKHTPRSKPSTCLAYCKNHVVTSWKLVHFIYTVIRIRQKCAKSPDFTALQLHPRIWDKTTWGTRSIRLDYLFSNERTVYKGNQVTWSENMLLRRIALPYSGCIVSVRRMIMKIVLLTRIASRGVTDLQNLLNEELHAENARTAHHTTCKTQHEI